MLENISCEKLQQLLSGGYFADLIGADLDKVDRFDLKRMYGLIKSEITVDISHSFLAKFVFPDDATLVDADKAKIPPEVIEIDRIDFYRWGLRPIESGEEYVREVNKPANFFPLSFNHFSALYEDWQKNQGNSVLEYLHHKKRDQKIYFPGCVLIITGKRYILSLCRHGKAGNPNWGITTKSLQDSDWGNCPAVIYRTL